MLLVNWNFHCPKDHDIRTSLLNLTVYIVNTGLSINTGSNPRQLMVIGFGKCIGSLSHTVADPSPHILMHNFMRLTKPARPPQYFFTYVMMAWGDLSYSM